MRQRRRASDSSGATTTARAIAKSEVAVAYDMGQAYESPHPDPLTVPTYPGRMETIPASQVQPLTVDDLIAALLDLGVAGGSTLVVHSSLSSLGWVCGGPVAVVTALRDVLGPEGTLVVPTHSADLSDPARWERPPVPETWWSVIRDTMPAFDADLTPTRAMGRIADTARHLPGAVRSTHPAYSFTAIGPQAADVTAGHALSNGFDEASPPARLYDLDADILLLGVGHANNTSLHLAEHRSGTGGLLSQGSPMLVDGVRRWVTYDVLDTNTDDFEALGRDCAAAGLERSGPVGATTARLMSQRALVDFATDWFVQHRGGSGMTD